jgi:hypothetical protein
MTLEEALARHRGHWHHGSRVAYQNVAGDLLLVDRRLEGWEEDASAVPTRVQRIKGTDKHKIAALVGFMGAGVAVAA